MESMSIIFKTVKSTFTYISGPPVLRGRLISRPLPDTAGNGPVLLLLTEARGSVSATPLAGLAWISVDNMCSIHYEVINACS